MASRKIYITEGDAQRLRELLRVQMGRNLRDRENLRVLDGEIRRGTIVKPGDVRPDVVTMNSRVLVEDASNGETLDCTLVFPEEADAAAGRISVVAPMGAALLGYRAGDRIQFKAPGGTQTLVIKQILFQPEADALCRTTQDEPAREVLDASSRR